MNRSARRRSPPTATASSRCAFRCRTGRRRRAGFARAISREACSTTSGASAARARATRSRSRRGGRGGRFAIRAPTAGASSRRCASSGSPTATGCSSSEYRSWNRDVRLAARL
eukprot:31560-Pelagococcus_subviridis.AAC.11